MELVGELLGALEDFDSFGEEVQRAARSVQTPEPGSLGVCVLSEGSDHPFGGSPPPYSNKELDGTLFSAV